MFFVYLMKLNTQVYTLIFRFTSDIVIYIYSMAFVWVVYQCCISFFL